jgi:hypothetical protein
MNNTDFNKICSHVCKQLKPSMVCELDRETLYFAIYWQLCSLFDQPLNPLGEMDPRKEAYRNRIHDLIRQHYAESFKALQMVDVLIEMTLQRYYDQIPQINGQATVSFRVSYN